MQKYEQPSNFWQNLTKQQKWGLVILVFFIVSVLAVWFVQLQSALYRPFYTGLDLDNNSYQAGQTSSKLGLTDEEARAVYLSGQDSDGDGLNDWEEENQYLTSPYLVDSDGDGLSDKEEVDNNTDPNCPEGENCLLIDDNIQQNTVDNNTDLFPVLEGLDNNSLIDPNSININDLEQMMTNPEQNLNTDESEILKQVFGEDPSPEVIRTVLFQAGVPEEQLNNIDDDELLTAYQEMLNSQ